MSRELEIHAMIDASGLSAVAKLELRTLAAVAAFLEHGGEVPTFDSLEREIRRRMAEQEREGA